jgi:phosphoenolpyruvate synthase/pyruvate phosphate dikinase
MKPFIKKFEEILINDVSIVGGKNASLGEMYNKLSTKGIKVPLVLLQQRLPLRLSLNTIT